MFNVEEIKNFIDQNETSKKQIEHIKKEVKNINKNISNLEHELEVSQKAIEMLREISDNTVKKSYEYLEKTINEALERIFVDEKRSIKITESIIKGQYPQISLEVRKETGLVISLVRDGHGIQQVVSLLSNLCLIVLTGSRRFMALDEVLSGVSNEALEIIDAILWDFAKLGFRFILNEHGFVVKGAKVYNIVMKNGISYVDDEYIEQNGIYRNFKGENYKEEVKENDEEDDEMSKLMERVNKV